MMAPSFEKITRNSLEDFQRDLPWIHGCFKLLHGTRL